MVLDVVIQSIYSQKGNPTRIYAVTIWILPLKGL